MSSTNKLNLSQNNHFSVTFNKVPKLNQLIQRVDAPSININPVPVPYKGAVVPASVGSIRFGPLNLAIRIDERQEIIHEIYSWMGLLHGLENVGVPLEVNMADYKEDLLVTYLDNNYTPILEYHYVGCVPQSFDIDPSQRGVSELLLANLVLDFDYLYLKTIE